MRSLLDTAHQGWIATTTYNLEDEPFGLAKSSEVREKDRVEARKAARGPKADTAEEDAANNAPIMLAFMVVMIVGVPVFGRADDAGDSSSDCVRMRCQQRS